MPATSVFQKLKVVTWKNFIITKRHWSSTAVTIAIPIAIIAFISIVLLIMEVGSGAHSDKPEDHNEPTYYPQLSSEIIYKIIEDSRHELQLYYTPQTKFTSSLISSVQSKLKLGSASLKSFATENELIAYYHPHKTSNISVMGIVFNGIEGEELPKHLHYTIRPDSFNNFAATMRPLKPFLRSQASSGHYFKEGSMTIHLAVDTSFIEMNNKKISFVLFLQQFPDPYRSRGYLYFLLLVLIYFTIISLWILSPDIVQRIGEVKNISQDLFFDFVPHILQELMKMMGLKSWMLWLGWFQYRLIINMVPVFAITFLLTIASVLRYCNKLLFAVFLILYYAAGITFLFAISSLFNKPAVMAIVAILAMPLTKYAPDQLLHSYPQMGWWLRILLALFPNTALTYGYTEISLYHYREAEINWTNLFQSASDGKEDVTLGNVFVMFLIDMVVYMLITLYFENVRPGPYGLSKPFHFPITFFFEHIKKTRSNRIDCHDNVIREDYCKIEPVSNLKAGIQIRNLYKYFGSYLAVNDLSIDIYEGQITALLGHNGAGKTTTMSILTGMIGASSGSVIINGANISCEMNKIHGILGLCPQHNLQFTDLTVMEHLIFFGMLKGLTYKEAQNEAAILLGNLNLAGAENSLAFDLSGGMRRRLSLGISLIGNSKVLILDEPTSGLDPEGRREIWNILLSLRGSRTIVISTHFMDEADVLGDRIAIMDHGRLICYGTSMYLKTDYGTGYHLTLILKSNKQVNSKQVDIITKIVKNTIGTAVLQSVIGSHLLYLLPNDMKPKFGTLLLELEKQRETLTISNIALSVTTLEDVFLKVGYLTHKRDNIVDIDEAQPMRSQGPVVRLLKVSNNFHISISITDGEAQPMKSQGNPSQKLIGRPLYSQQIKALLTKCLLTTKANFSIFLFTFLLMLALTLIILNQSDTTKSATVAEFKMALSNYGETLVYYGPSSTNRDVNEMKKIYAQLIQEQNSHAVLANSVSDSLISKGIDNIVYYEKHMVVAAEFNTSSGDEIKVNAMYSNTAIDGAPISLNILTNALVKTLFGKDHGISTSYNPLPGNNNPPLPMLAVALWSVLFPFGLLLYTATFILLPQMERATKVKQLQLMCGVRSYFYWLSFYVFDLVLYWMMVIAIIILILLYELWGSTNYSGINEIYSLTSDKCKAYLSYFEKDKNISVYLEIMMASTFLYFAILFLLESKFTFKTVEHVRLSNDQIQSNTELEEHQDEDRMLIVKRLTKIYNSKQVVRGVSFAIKRGDCFGLLGVNGAGKTTTLRMLTGDEIPTDGDAEIKDILGNSFKLSKNAKEYCKQIGYCPQFDAIIEVLTGRQMLKLFAELRGEPKDVIEGEVNKWIAVLNLQDYVDIQCGRYSGGNKRKLNAAIAFISNPLLVMLDEPTSGTDPFSRRKLWNMIALLRQQEVKTTVVLCSHSMDECEALCKRLTIMKAGRLECIGTITEVKQQYGQGFTVKIKLRNFTSNAVQEIVDVQTQNELTNVTTDNESEDPEEVQLLLRDFEHKYLGTCKLCDKHSGLLHYRIDDENKKLGQLFNEMEDLSHKHPIIEDYQISDTSLEEVFLSIARS